MSKKIILISAIILSLTVALTACKSKKYNPSAETTDKVVQTVTVTNENGTVTTVEIFEDASGDKYITNVDGDKIPLTTDDSGYSDDIGYLITSKPAEESKTGSPSKTENSTANNTPTSGSAESSTESEKTSSENSSKGNDIVIDSKVPQDSISWDEIKNPKKNS